MASEQEKHIPDEAVASKGPKAGAKQISTSELPRRTLEECLAVARPIYEIYAGGSASWDELASAMGVGAKSATTKYLIWGAQGYELIRKEAEKFHLSETGRKILAPNYPEEQIEAAVKAVMIPTILSKFYSDYDGKLLPEETFFDNVLENRYQIPRDRVAEAKQIILANAGFAQILNSHPNGKKTIRLDGAPTSKESRGVTLPRQESQRLERQGSETLDDIPNLESEVAPPEEGESLCFFITPIGEEGSMERRHADMLLKHLVEPTFAEFNIRVIRADKIGKSGLISQQIFEHIVSARFCVADLSFGNPNAFYELGVRHMTKLPTIQIIRKGDKIPFDVAQGRTIVVDVSDIYTLMDKMDSARKELSEHIRNYLNPQDSVRADDNPVSIYLPSMQVKLPKLNS